MDRHRFDADPDLDPTSHFDAYPDPDPNPSFTLVEKSKFLLLLFTAMPVYIVLSFSSRRQCQNLRILESILNFSGKKYSLPWLKWKRIRIRLRVRPKDVDPTLRAMIDIEGHGVISALSFIIDMV